MTPTAIQKYIEAEKEKLASDPQGQYSSILRDIDRFKPLGSDTKIFEVGCGLGTFQRICSERGLSCKGIDKSVDLIEHCHALGISNVEVRDIEQTVGFNEYDVVVATSVFEHVKHWRTGLRNVYYALKPGGLLYFISSNRYSISPMGEGGFLPFFGMLPNEVRWQIQVWQHGKDMRENGLNYNQFTHSQLKRECKALGFGKVYDFTEFVRPDDFTGVRKLAMRAIQSSRAMKAVGSIAAPITWVIAIK